MKINYLKYCTFFVLYLITTTVSAQNYVYNGGFENGNAQGAKNANNPSMGGGITNTIPYLDNWEKADNQNLHSPDWWRKGAPSLNFEAHNAQGHDDDHFYPSFAPYAFFYDGFFPHIGYGMAGLYSHELIQQKINSSALKNALDNSSWNSITLKMWVRMSTEKPPVDQTLKVFLSKSSMEYKQKGEPCDNPNFRTYKSTNRLEILSIPNVGVAYPRGEWHLITKVFNIPSSVNNISAYDWIVIDMNYDDCDRKKYIFIDDVELTVGCPDGCSATDGTVEPSISNDLITANTLFTIDNVHNASSVRLEIYNIGGASTYFDETISCINGVDHSLYWDGTVSGGVGIPVANAKYGYRITTYNDCGQQKFTGTVTKYADYTGSNGNNFNIPCSNGINQTPTPCCWASPDLYINNTTIVGPTPGWSNYIMPLNIWACTDQTDFSDWVKVEHDAKVLFRAGKQVTLREGFHVEEGGIFCAEIKPCNRPDDTDTKAKGRSSNSREIGEVETEPELIENTELKEGIKVYPNPTTGVVNVDLSYFYVENKTYQLSIYNVLGGKIESFEVDSPTLTIRLQDHPKGIYLIEVSDGTNQHVVKLIKS